MVLRLVLDIENKRNLKKIMDMNAQSYVTTLTGSLRYKTAIKKCTAVIS